MTTCPAGRVTVPVNVGDARGALSARSDTRFVTCDSAILGISPAMRFDQAVTSPFASKVIFVLVAPVIAVFATTFEARSVTSPVTFACGIAVKVPD